MVSVLVNSVGTPTGAPGAGGVHCQYWRGGDPGTLARVHRGDCVRPCKEAGTVVRGSPRKGESRREEGGWDGAPHVMGRGRDPALSPQPGVHCPHNADLFLGVL